MNRYRKRRSRLVVSPSPWSVNTVLLVIVFIVTSGLVYYWGQVARRSGRSAANYSATAIVLHAELPHAAEGSLGGDLLAWADWQIRFRESLHAAESHVAPPEAVGLPNADAPIDQPEVTDWLQERLRVSLEESGGGEVRVRLSYTDTDRDQASELVRAVAQQYVETLRREWNRHTETVHAGAATAAEEARRRWELAEGEQQAFVEWFLQSQEQEVRQAAPAKTPLPLPVTPAPTTRVENPDWSRLDQRRIRLERRRAELLAERTPAHPEVQALKHELAETHQALSGMARWLDPPPAQTQPESRPAESLPTPTPESGIAPEQAGRKHADARREIDRLGREAALARSRYEQLARVERAAWADHLREPEVEVSFAPPVEVAPDPSLEHLLSTSLLAGMAMMVGVGMFAAGAGMEPTLVSAEQASALLDVPVVATVTLPGLKTTGAGRHRGWLRISSCLGGAVLIAGCLGLLWRAITG